MKNPHGWLKLWDDLAIEIVRHNYSNEEILAKIHEMEEKFISDYGTNGYGKCKHCNS
jgi:hypothetical protein